MKNNRKKKPITNQMDSKNPGPSRGWRKQTKVIGVELGTTGGRVQELKVGEENLRFQTVA
jgi:hypothetical protein